MFECISCFLLVSNISLRILQPAGYFGRGMQYPGHHPLILPPLFSLRPSFLLISFDFVLVAPWAQLNLLKLPGSAFVVYCQPPSNVYYTPKIFKFSFQNFFVPKKKMAHALRQREGVSQQPVLDCAPQ